jgi:hypothetical protein
MRIGDTPIKCASDIADALGWQVDMEGRTPAEALEDLETAIKIYGDEITRLAVKFLLEFAKVMVVEVENDGGPEMARVNFREACHKARQKRSWRGGDQLMSKKTTSKQASQTFDRSTYKVIEMLVKRDPATGGLKLTETGKAFRDRRTSVAKRKN